MQNHPPYLPQQPRPVVRTAARVRWGRISVSVVGVAMIAVGVWSAVGMQPKDAAAARGNAGEQAALATLTPLGSGKSAGATTVAAAGGAHAHVYGNPNVGLPTVAPSKIPATPPQKIVTTPPQKIVTPAVNPPMKNDPPMKGVTPTPATTPAPASTPTPAPAADPVDSSVEPAATPAPTTDPTPAPEVVATKPTVDGGGPTAAPDDPAVAGAHSQPTSVAPVRGGGAPELPYTGASTWIVAIIGVLVLLAGILIQINAVRIGMTAMLYRRGILLRPVDCARLAHERGLPRLRVWLSNVLHYLLEEPATSDFVTAR